MTYMYPPWAYPADRYCYDWYGPEAIPPQQPTDGDIKSMVVDQLRANRHTKGDHITVDVKRNVVILTGDVSSTLAKRAAGDDAWDTPGVVDVSNQLRKAPRVRQLRMRHSRGKHGDERNITWSEIEAAAAANDQAPDQAVDNMRKMAQSQR